MIRIKYLKKIISIFMAVTMLFVFDFSFDMKANAGTKIDSAVAWAIKIANDDTHGYDQDNRQGPDYDCSSFVLNAFKQAGVDIGGASYTGDMKSKLTKKGFKWYDWSSIGSVSKLQKGDIVWRTKHTELYIGNKKLAGARHNEKNGIKGGKTGDQYGNEISIEDFSKCGSWTGIFRYTKDTIDPNVYVEIPKDQYFIKNSSTGTYINGSSASNGGAISLAAKKNTNAFKFNVASGSKDAGYILTSSVNTGYVLNPYSDTPGDGTKITLYSKSGDGTQNWKFEQSGKGYIIHNAYDTNYVLTQSGTGIVLKKDTGAANQIWYLESTTALSSISISTAPSTTVYENGTAFSASGMVVKAAYSNGTSKTITDYKTSYDFSKAGNVNVTVSYTENGVTKTATQAVTVQDVFKGSGTEEDPYQIGTADDLNNLAKQINNIKAVGCYGAASYIQTADIKVGTMAEPIGTCYADSTSETISLLAVFKGHYNGNFHKLYDVKMDYARSYAGIFGKTGGASVVENLEVCGEIRGVCYIGGIIGEIGYGATIKNCSFNGIVNADSYLGGIVGRNINGGKISGCYANARVTANNGYAGGISGYVETGGNESATNVLIENCYFTGKSIGTCCGAVAGGVVIDTAKQCTVTFDNCYFLDSSSKDAVNSKEYSGCTALDSASLKKSGAKLLGTPFVAADTGVNDGYPVFEWQNIPVLIGDVDNDDVVTVADAVKLQKYLVKSAELVNISAGDMDGNGKLNVFDSILIKRELCAVNS